MLNDRNVVPNLAVRDLEVARRFYRDTLGLQEVGEEEDAELVVFRSGDSHLNLYKSAQAGTNKATAVTWSVGEELETVIRTLKDKGVSFEHYDMPGMTRQGDVHVAGKMKAAWFKDPDGNILNIVNG